LVDTDVNFAACVRMHRKQQVHFFDSELVGYHAYCGESNHVQQPEAA
jgi:hypothetical protein